MSIAPTEVDDLPPAPDPDDDEGDFDSEAYTWSVALVPFTDQMNALGENVFANAAAAEAAAADAADDAAAIAGQVAAAAASAKASSDSAAAALASQSAAANSATAANTSAGNAAQSATDAASAAAGLKGTSTSSLLIALGSKSFTTQAGKQFTVGAWVMAPSAANPANYMFGQVTSYAGTALVLDVQVIGGSGTFADWALSVSGVRGAKGDKGDTGPAFDPGVYAITTEGYSLTLAVAGNNSIADIIQVDANRVLHTIQSANALHAVCYDRSTKLFGAPVLLRSFSGTPLTAAKLTSTDKVLVASVVSGATALEAVVLSLTGTSIAVGTPATSTLPETAAALRRNPVTCGASFIFSFNLASTARLIAMTVSGTTPTIGAPLTVAGNASMRPIDATRLLAVFIASGNFTAVPVTVSSGTTLTLGTAASTTGSAMRFLAALTTGRWAAVYTATNCMGALISVSGTVATMTTVTLNAAADSGGQVGKIGDQLVVQCSSTIFNVLTDVAGTATSGTGVSQSGSTGSICGYGPDYVAYSTGVGVVSFKIIGNNAVPIYSSGAAGVSFTPGGGINIDDAVPNAVLSLNGKSSIPCPGASYLTGVIPANLQGMKICMVSQEPLNSGSIRNQSESVCWSSNNSTSSTNLRLVRGEMV